MSAPIPAPPDVPPCDTCGAPASSVATDILLQPNYVTGLMDQTPIGKLKYGCDRHPAESKDCYSDPIWPWPVEAER